MIIALILSHILFISYFITIGSRYLALLPISVALVFFLSTQRSEKQSLSISEFLERQSLFFAWIMIHIWAIGFLHVTGTSYATIFIGVMLVNLILWISSYPMNYKDGYKLFHIGRVLWALLFVGTQVTQWFRPTLQLIFSLIAFASGVYSFVVFIIGIRRKEALELRYSLFVLRQMTIIAALIKTCVNIPQYALLISQIYYTILLACCRIAFDLKNTYTHLSTIDVKDILIGKRITEKEKLKPGRLLEEIFSFLRQMNEESRMFLSVLNIGFVIGTVISFGFLMKSISLREWQAIYRASIILFLISSRLIKKLDFASNLQKLPLFLVITFGVYLSIRTISNQNTVALITGGVIRNMLTFAWLVRAEDAIRRERIVPRDLWYRIGASSVGALVNCFFLTQLQLSGQIIFSLIFFYAGVVSIMIMYAIKHYRTLRAFYEPDDIDIEMLMNNG